MTTAFFLILTAFLVREALFQMQIQKLVNKLMSRNYQEYQMSQAIQPVGPHEVAPQQYNDEYKDSDLETLNQLI